MHELRLAQLVMLNGSCLSFCSDDALGREDCVIVPVIDDDRFYHMLFCYLFWTMCNALDAMYEHMMISMLL